MMFSDERLCTEWERLFDATLHVRGPVSEIIDKMNGFVRGEICNQLWRELGVCSAGFLFEDVGMRDRQFLGAVQQDSFFTDYLWQDEEQQKTYWELLHFLFLRIRRVQKRKRTDIVEEEFKELGYTDLDQLPNLPSPQRKDLEARLQERFVAEEEYLRYLSEQAKRPAESDDASRLADAEDAVFPADMFAAGLHYCSMGETVLTTAIWRLLTFLVERGEGAKPLEKIALSLTHQRRSEPTCAWQSESMFENTVQSEFHGIDLYRMLDGQKKLNNTEKKRATKHEQANINILQSLWNEKFSDKDRWKDEWTKLNLSADEPNGDGAYCRRALLEFAHQIGVETPPMEGEEIADEVLNTLLVSSIPTLLVKLGVNCRGFNVEQALAALERFARFPILPFFVWNFLDTGVKTYLVSSTWVTQNFSLKVHGGRECHHLGFALCGVLPMAQIDTTIPEGLKEDRRIVSQANPRTVQNLFNRLTQPMVETNLYVILTETERSKKVAARMEEATRGSQRLNPPEMDGE